MSRINVSNDSTAVSVCFGAYIAKARIIAIFIRDRRDGRPLATIGLFKGLVRMHGVLGRFDVGYELSDRATNPFRFCLPNESGSGV